MGGERKEYCNSQNNTAHRKNAHVLSHSGPTVTTQSPLLTVCRVIIKLLQPTGFIGSDLQRRETLD